MAGAVKIDRVPRFIMRSIAFNLFNTVLLAALRVHQVALAEQMGYAVLTDEPNLFLFIFIEHAQSSSINGYPEPRCSRQWTFTWKLFSEASTQKCVEPKEQGYWHRLALHSLTFFTTNWIRIVIKVHQPNPMYRLEQWTVGAHANEHKQINRRRKTDERKNARRDERTIDIE